MPLPDSVTTRHVVGRFLDISGDPVVGAAIRFRPSPARLLVVDEPAVLLPGLITVETDTAGDIDVELATTDDESINPTGWTWSVVIDIPRTQWAAQPYGFAFELPADPDPLDLTTVTPVSVCGGTPIIQGPPGPGTSVGAHDTVDAPDPATVDVGGWYYDLDLSVPFWSDGTVWRDAAGVVRP